MRRRALVAAVCLTSTLILPTAPALAAPPSDPATEAVSRLPLQKLKWQRCLEPGVPARYARLQCATLKAPRDWAKPNGPKITLAISRLKAKSGKPKGVLFTNPGGPGQVGLFLPLILMDAGRTRLLQTQDVIGIDVRGTGYSTQTRCKDAYYYPGLDPRDRSAPSIRRQLEEGASTAGACQTGGGLPSRYVTTAQTVRDLEWIRRNLKTSNGKAVTKVNWLGYSAGTWLGAHYAAAFPKRAGRFVLDSNTQFTGTWQQDNHRQPLGFQRRFARDFAQWAARYDGLYGLGTTAPGVVARYEAVRAAIAGLSGVEVEYVDGTTDILYAADLDYLVAMSLYSKIQFPGLAADLRALSPVIADAAARALPVRLRAPDPYAGENPTFIKILCNDTPFQGTPAQHAAKSTEIGRKYPLVGYSLTSDPCAHWKRPQGVKLKRPTGKGLPRVLMIQSRTDAATPYEGAVIAHRKYKNSRLVTVNNEGDHALYASGNACVDKVVDAYLIDGVYPKKDRTCPGVPIPAPANGRLAGVPDNPLLRARELAGTLKLG
ncbi:alpha/beta hydrolase [Actinocorallia sp. API 0066]|uniref:alpha/beta hydrolase n=1 Tax=Actinocorallia sp. API 0066 TaxID=2896846 RepID=UPI001E623AB3|nr:alpha/beta hydrolase [Actinocorallia sp. API 0066]MCD0447720.1 alpha/beta hydrolase [Actinocorallia sp. API 0066]